MPVYRYRFDHVSISELSRRVPGSLVLGSQTPVFVDITAPTGSKDDLDGILATRGYAYVSTDPSTTPTEQTVTDLGVTDFDVRDVLVYDHFVTGNAGDTDEFGLMGWRVSTGGTGPNVTVLPGATGHPGIAKLEAGTTAAARAAIHLGDATINGNFLLTGTQNQLDMEWLVRPSASIATTDLEMYQIGYGLEWTTDGQLSNGVYIRYQPGTDTNWSLVSANAGSRTVSAGTTPPVLNTWYRLGIRMTWPGGTPTAQLLVNGVAEGTAITANIPTGAVGVGIKIDSVGAIVTEPVIDVDYVLVTQITAKET